MGRKRLSLVKAAKASAPVWPDGNFTPPKSRPNRRSTPQHPQIGLALPVIAPALPGAGGQLSFSGLVLQSGQFELPPQRIAALSGVGTASGQKETCFAT